MNMLFLLYLLSIHSCRGADLGAHLQSMDIAYERFNGMPRYALLQSIEDRPTTLLTISFSLGVLDWVYMDNKVETRTDISQYRTVSWEYEAGIRPWNGPIQVFLHHRSEHLLDTQGPVGFPEHDSVGIRVKVYQR